MKITGAEFKEWHDTAWPEGWVWADESLLDDNRELYAEDGSLVVKPDEVFTIPAFWSILPETIPAHEGATIRSLIKKWRKSQSTITLAIKVPRDREDEVRAYLYHQNLKVLA